MNKNKNIDKPIVVAVEGADYLYFILSQIQGKDEFAAIQLWDFADWTIEEALSQLRKQSAFVRNEVKALGIIRDAEEDRNKEETNIKRSLERNSLPVPEQPLQIARGTPAVGYLIMPHDEKSGCLEHACLKASTLAPDHVKCGDAFLDMVSPFHKRKLNEAWRAKVKVHALIAGSGFHPASTLGESAKQGMWNFTNPSIKILLEFICMLKEAS